MGTKLAIHGASFKKGAVVGCDHHNRRWNEKYGNEDIDQSRTHENFSFKEPAVSLYQDLKLEVERVKQNGGRIRSDSNWFCEFCVYAPKNLSKEQYKAYFKAVNDFFMDRVGESNVKLSVVHMDETTPHMHLDFCPLIRNEDGEPVKLSSKAIMTRQFLKSLHEELPKKLREHGFDVVRGDEVKVEDKPLKGRSVKRYKADMEREREALQAEVSALQAHIDELRSECEELLQWHENASLKATEDVKMVKGITAAMIPKLQQKIANMAFERGFGLPNLPKSKKKSISDLEGIIAKGKAKNEAVSKANSDLPIKKKSWRDDAR